MRLFVGGVAVLKAAARHNLRIFAGIAGVEEAC